VFDYKITYILLIIENTTGMLHLKKGTLGGAEQVEDSSVTS